MRFGPEARRRLRYAFVNAAGEPRPEREVVAHWWTDFNTAGEMAASGSGVIERD